MRRQGSIQRRLGIGLALGVTVMWLIATGAAGLVVRHEIDEVFDSGLQETAQRLLSLAVIDIVGRDDGATARRVAALGPHDELLTYLVRDRSGKILLQSHDADPATFPPVPILGFRSTPTHRLYGESAVSGTVLIEVAEPLSHRRQAAFEAALVLFAPLPFLVPLSLVGVWWLARRSLRPVLAFKAEIEARGEGDLSPVAARHLPAELGPIAGAVNHLMDRLRRALDAERSFTANSAHELRTPIAAALAQTQRLIVETPEGAARDRARRIEASLRRLATVSEKLMQLARAEGGGLLAETPQDLLPVLELVLDGFRRGPDVEDRLRLDTQGVAALWSRMDPDAFAILMRNLIENALKHGPSDGAVAVALSADGAIHVVNAGPAVAPQVLARLRGRFERGGSDAEGAGLGLAIAETIATGVGGRLDLLSPASSRLDGFEAVFHLPASRPERAPPSVSPAT